MSHPHQNGQYSFPGQHHYYNPQFNPYQQQQQQQQQQPQPQSPAFYQELQQCSSPQAYGAPLQYTSAPLGTPYQPPPNSNVQVIVPTQQIPSQYQQVPQQSGYSYNQQVASTATYQSHQPPAPFQPQSVHGSGPMPPRQPSAILVNGEPTQQNGHPPAPPTSRKTSEQQAGSSNRQPSYPALLLSLADEYFAAANQNNDRSEMYFKLIATGLGCLESVLSNFKLSPLREAQVSLKYAQVLYDETENYDDAERVLTKAIDVCERNKYLDLKYNLQLLLACVLYQSKPRAAIKDLMSMLEELGAYKHAAWEYAARYQLAIFYLSSPTVQDLHSAIQHLEKLVFLTTSNGDKAVAAFAHIITSLVHLQTSANDAVSSSQQALAKARGLSSSEEVSRIPQITMMTELIDLCTSIRDFKFRQSDEQRKRVTKLWEEMQKVGSWATGAVLYLPVDQDSLRGVQLQQGGTVWEVGGRYVLPFKWLDQNEVGAWIWLLNTMGKLSRPASDDKAEYFIEKGLECCRDSDSTPVTSKHRKLLECHLLVELAFIKCQRGRWQEADDVVERSERLAEAVPATLESVRQYLRGAIQQGIGNLDAAVKIYSSQIFGLNQFIPSSSTPGQSHKVTDSSQDTMRNLAILAAINKITIINTPTHPLYDTTMPALEQVTPLVAASADKNIKNAFSLIRSNIVYTDAIMPHKNTLVHTLDVAKPLANAQVKALILMTMFEKFLYTTNENQAVQCLKAGSTQIRNWGNETWLAVVAGVEAKAIDFWGNGGDANVKYEEARLRLRELPEGVRRSIGI